MDKRTKEAVRIAVRGLPTVRIDELVPYANNAKIHGPEQIEQLRRSLREFGFVSPVLIDEERNLIAGHGRVEAARAEGMTEVPYVLVSELSEAQRRAYIIADNRLAETGEWDAARLKFEMEELSSLSFDTSLTGFTMVEVSDGLLNIDSNSQSHSCETAQRILRIDDQQVIMTDNEADQLLSKLNEYIDRVGCSFGFVGELING